MRFFFCERGMLSMTTSANPDGQGCGAACTPQSFVKGLYLLTKSFVKDSAGPLAPFALLMLLLTLNSIPAVSNYRLGVNDFALASVATFILSAGCGALAYFKKPYRYEFLLATLFMVMVHMLSAMLTTQLAPTQVFYGDNWWKAAPLLLKAAVLPMYVTMVLVQFALAAGVLGLAVWGLYKLPKATRAAARYICQTGQGK
jgi:hypothetical protein